MSSRPWERPLLRALRHRGNRQLAADFARVSLRTVQRHERRDPAFRRRVDSAIRQWVKSESERRVEQVDALLAAEE